MTQVFTSLVPIFLLIGLGALLLRLGFYGEPFRNGLERFVYWVALPCLFVSELATTRFEEIGALGLTVALSAATVGAALLSLAIAAALRLPRAAVGVLVQGAMRGNLVFVGLPVIVFALDGLGLSAAAAARIESASVLALAPVIVLYNAASVLALVLPQRRIGRDTAGKLLKSLAFNPLIIGCLVGLVLSLLGAPLPMAALRSLAMIGGTAGPMALIALGGALVTLPWRGELLRATAASGVKLLAVPAVTYAMCVLLRLDASLTLAAMVFATTPTAVASYVLATQLKGDGALAASCVVVSTVLSFPALAAVLYLFG